MRVKAFPLLSVLCAIACLANAAEPTVQVDLGGGVTLALVLIPAGDFQQGSPENEIGRSSDESQRTVKLTSDYYLGKTAVTRQQWERFVLETNYRTEAELGPSGGFGWDGNTLTQKKQFTWKDPGFQQSHDDPVCLVTFPDAQEFCAWLERKAQRKTTLPTEAQWEYACRAGSSTPWHSGTDADATVWHKDNSGHRTHPVASKPSNAWGLHMGGNVAEWCLDWYAPYQAGPVTDPRGDQPEPGDKIRRVLRGGSWNREAKHSRSAARYRADARSRIADIGFRVACTAAEKANPPPAQKTPSPQPSSTGTTTITHPSSDESSTPGSIWQALRVLLPIGLIILFVELVKRLLKRPSGANPTPSPATPPPVRKVNDGFWIYGDWAPGTSLKVSYTLAGEKHIRDLTYQPGPEGHFVFTGSAPDSITVEADPTGMLYPEPSMQSNVTASDNFRSRDNDLAQLSGSRSSRQNQDDEPSSTEPPTTPSAY